MYGPIHESMCGRGVAWFPWRIANGFVGCGHILDLVLSYGRGFMLNFFFFRIAVGGYKCGIFAVLYVG